MQQIINLVLITLWLFGLLYLSFPKKDELIEQYGLEVSDLNKSIDKNIMNYSLFLIVNAVVVVILGFYQLMYNSSTNSQIVGVVLLTTGVLLCVASYGIRQKYSWSRYMTSLLLILATIIIISTTELNHNVISYLNPTNSIIDLQSYYNPLTWTDVGIYLIKIGYFAALSLVSTRFLEKPLIKAIISR